MLRTIWGVVFQMDPRGVEAGILKLLFNAPDGFRWTLVGLKPAWVVTQGPPWPSFRWTLVGLKLITKALLLEYIFVSDGPSWG